MDQNTGRQRPPPSFGISGFILGLGALVVLAIVGSLAARQGTNPADAPQNQHREQAQAPAEAAPADAKTSPPVHGAPAEAKSEPAAENPPAEAKGDQPPPPADAANKDQPPEAPKP